MRKDRQLEVINPDQPQPLSKRVLGNPGEIAAMSGRKDKSAGNDKVQIAPKNMMASCLSRLDCHKTPSCGGLWEKEYGSGAPVRDVTRMYRVLR